MKEELINFKTARLAKEKGFNEKTFYYYVNEFSSFKSDGVPKKWSYSIDEKNLYVSRNSSKGQPHLLVCPTQSLLQKWLREEHNIDIYIRGYGFGYYPSLNNVPPANQTVFYVDRRWNLTNKEGFDNLVTYEEALEKGLQEALKLIKNEEKNNN